MALTIVDSHAVTGGVDTHADTHVAAALDHIGGLLGVESFPTTRAGYGDLLAWLGGFGTVRLVGVEGTGSYGAGLARHLAAAGVRVVEVDCPDRQERRRSGKSDPLDAVSAARAALSRKAKGAPPGRDGTVEAIRALRVAKRSARGERTRSVNQARTDSRARPPPVLAPRRRAPTHPRSPRGRRIGQADPAGERQLRLAGHPSHRRWGRHT